MFSRRSRVISFSFVVSDLITTAVVFALAYWARAWMGHQGWDHLRGIYSFKAYLPLLYSALLAFPLLGYILGAYQRVEFRHPRDLAIDAVKMVTVGMLSLVAGLFIFRGLYVSRSLLLVFGCLEVLLLASSRWLFLVGGKWLRARPDNYRNFVIVGTPTSAAEVASLLEEGEHFGLRLLAFVYSGDKEPSLPPGLRYAYSVLPKERLSDLLHNHVVDEVVFAVDREELTELEPLMQQCEEEGVHMRVQLDFLPKGFSHVFVEHLAHVPLLTFASTPQNQIALFSKRAADIVLSQFLLLVLSPLFLLLALLIRITSPGPILYRQTRCGLGGRRFTLYKFRSMVANADQLRTQLNEFNEVDGPVFKMAQDPRCTPLGRWLRKFSLDELPQLWNVLRGDMSFVGPRPPLPEEVGRYEPWQRRRLRMRPGLTCLWALEGRNRLNFDRWVRFDLAYIDNWSLWLDLKIFLKTIPHALSGRGAS